MIIVKNNNSSHQQNNLDVEIDAPIKLYKCVRKHKIQTELYSYRISINGHKYNGRIVNNIAYYDDTAIFDINKSKKVFQRLTIFVDDKIYDEDIIDMLPLWQYEPVKVKIGGEVVPCKIYYTIVNRECFDGEKGLFLFDIRFVEVR